MSLFFDDLAVGTRFESGTTTLDAAAIREFAAQYDPQPFHLDDAAARTTLFGGLAASGWHTAAVTMRLLVESVPIAGGLIGAGNDISWPRPTRPDDVLRVVTDVVEMTPSASRPDRGRVVMRSETLNQNGEVVQILLARLVVPRRTP
ncbi:MaoC family dehydratase [Acidiphilium sp.]|uniref:MaoC family dehydratase n=1 Tax=Acidiphilium sp. TaxID=527 RepID=UPI002589E5EC|nr:MaoC family dehydratase [Acidiphilium sp.]